MEKQITHQRAWPQSKLMHNQKVHATPDLVVKSLQYLRCRKQIIMYQT